MKIYLVGGAVRDMLMNLKPEDKDYVVVGAEPQELLNLGFKQVGADFPVFLYPVTHEEYALARTEKKNGIGYQGFKVLHPKIGMIYGEAIDGEMQERIYKGMVEAGWCVSNVLMGVGSWGFLKNASRDSYSIAIKGTHSIVNGRDVSMQKNPKTALNSKKSARGRLRVELVNGDYVLHENQTQEQFETGELKLAFRNGKIVNFQSWKEVKERAHVGL